MTCKYTSRDIGRYLFNKMTLDEETEFQFHLSQCSQCQSELQAIRDLTEGLKDEEVEVKELQEKSYLPSRKRIFLYRSLVAASILLLCCLGIAFFYNPNNTPTQKALIPDTYLYQDSVSNRQDTLPQSTMKDTL